MCKIAGQVCIPGIVRDPTPGESFYESSQGKVYGEFQETESPRHAHADLVCNQDAVHPSVPEAITVIRNDQIRPDFPDRPSELLVFTGNTEQKQGGQ
jgi:hypothetical protein